MTDLILIDDHKRGRQNHEHHRERQGEARAGSEPAQRLRLAAAGGPGFRDQRRQEDRAEREQDDQQQQGHHSPLRQWKENKLGMFAPIIL